MTKITDNRYDAYLFTFKAEDWDWDGEGDGLEKFLKKWVKNHETTEEWSSGSSKSVPEGVPIFLLKQGKAPTGIIAAGFTASENHPHQRWSEKKGKMVTGRANELRFTHFLDPEEDQLLDINDLPKQYWAARGSGVGLSSVIFRTIKDRWNTLLQANATEKVEARKALNLAAEDADGAFEISNEDTRATALKQIKQRRGQRAFRQKMIGVYGGKCAISGCTVTAVLEAAHIKPHLGENDQNTRNGLLLRADLHTLFDLSLLGIDPLTTTVHSHPSLQGSEYQEFNGKPLQKAKTSPSFEALRLRWRMFKELKMRL